jgi:hypothetical protein
VRLTQVEVDVQFANDVFSLRFQAQFDKVPGVLKTFRSKKSEHLIFRSLDPFGSLATDTTDIAWLG